MNTTIQDNLEISVEEVKDWLNIMQLDIDEDIEVEIESFEDETFERMIDTAKEQADLLVDRDLDYFENEEIPSSIKQWCLEYVARMFEKRVNGISDKSIPNAESVSWKETDYNKLLKYRSFLGF